MRQFRGRLAEVHHIQGAAIRHSAVIPHWHYGGERNRMPADRHTVRDCGKQRTPEPQHKTPANDRVLRRIYDVLHIHEREQHTAEERAIRIHGAVHSRERADRLHRSDSRQLHFETALKTKQLTKTKKLITFASQSFKQAT